MRSSVAIVCVVAAASLTLAAASAPGGDGMQLERRSAASTGASVPRGSHVRAPTGGVLVVSCSGCPAYDEGSMLSTLGTDGRGLRALRGTEGSYSPIWSPRGERVAFHASGAIWTSAPDGSRRRRITDAQEGEPAWSPDGRRIVFVRSTGGHPPNECCGDVRTALWVVDLRTSRERQLVTADVNVVSPAWSPDGRRIAFNDVLERLWVVNANGSGRRRLGPTSLRGRAPRWSPEGARVAFLGHEEDRLTLRILLLRTRRTRTVFRRPSAGTGPAHAWSPDGRWLVATAVRPYSCDAGGGPEQCQRAEIAVVRVADAASRTIFSAPYGEWYGIDWRRRSAARLRPDAGPFVVAHSRARRPGAP